MSVGKPTLRQALPAFRAASGLPWEAGDGSGYVPCEPVWTTETTRTTSGAESYEALTFPADVLVTVAADSLVTLTGCE